MSELSELLSEHFGSEESAATILYTTINSPVLCWCSYSVQQYETHAAPPDLEPAEGRGAAYNYNNFSLTVAGGLGCCLYL